MSYNITIDVIMLFKGLIRRLSSKSFCKNCKKQIPKEGNFCDQYCFWDFKNQK